MSSSPLQVAKRLEGKIALITGGASGLGENTARLFAKHGANVIIADVQSDLGQSISEQIQSESGQQVSYVHCDVTIESDVEKAVNTAITKHGKLDIMFNNAGILRNTDKAIASIEYESFKRVFDVNLYGGFLGAKHASRVMIPQKKGCILFSASLASVLYGGAYAYTVSKHAVVGLTKNLAVELGQYGIRVNCISPAHVPSPMTTIGLGLNDEQVHAMASSVAILKEEKLEPKDVAEAALYLASDDSKFVSGLNLIIDGAASLPKV